MRHTIRCGDMWRVKSAHICGGFTGFDADEEMTAIMEGTLVLIVSTDHPNMGRRFGGRSAALRIGYNDYLKCLTAGQRLYIPREWIVKYCDVDTS
jgi:hypothetical protein